MRRLFSLSNNHGVDKGPRPLMFNPALTTCASERMKTQRFSYFAGFAARRPAAAGQFRPVSRGGTSCFLREAKPVKTRKSGVQPLFRQSKRRHAPSFLLSSVAQGLYLVLVYPVEVYADKGYGAKLRYGEGVPYGRQANSAGEYEGHWQKYRKLAKGG